MTLNNGRKKALYQLSIAAIFVHIAISIGCYVVVAAVWRFRRKNWNGRLKNNVTESPFRKRSESKIVRRTEYVKRTLKSVLFYYLQKRKNRYSKLE